MIPALRFGTLTITPNTHESDDEQLTKIRQIRDQTTGNFHGVTKVGDCFSVSAQRMQRTSTDGRSHMEQSDKAREAAESRLKDNLERAGYIVDQRSAYD